ncbi:hypothetical protein [Endozoicomonas sp. SESOKO1]|uniref:hypothetical protein n=1 Tax=Endozoicomonas sp. SESOKO1 TaxID=2828742 RepID=UPI002147DE3A|nr:hypothetical protein [Endozoicomonas sp. SESOKO1]
MTITAQPASSTFFASAPDSGTAHGHSKESVYSFGRKVISFFTSSFTKSHMSSSSSEERSAWNNISSFFKGLYSRAVKIVNYVSRHIGEMLPPYLTKAGIGSVAGFVIGALTPIGPLWGTVGGLLIATGWQLGVECNIDRDHPASARP